MVNKTDRFLQGITSCPLQCQELWILYIMIFILSIIYSFTKIYLHEEQLDKLHRRIIKHALAKLGISSKLPIALIFGSARLGGLGIENLNATHLIHKVKVLMKHITAGTDIGTSLLIMVFQAQLISWYENKILMLDYHTPYLGSKWVGHLQTQFQKIRGKLLIKEAWISTLSKTLDISIMESIKRYHNWTNQELNRINYYRLYLRAT